MPAISRAKFALLGLLVAFGAQVWFAAPFTVDDAYITARYAARLSAGLGYTFNDGPATDGVTGPLWLLPMLLAVKMGLDPLICAKLTGAVCSLAAAAACVVRASQRASGTFLAGWTAALAVASVALAAWSVGGLETGAAVLAFTGMALATTARGRPRSLHLGAWVALAAWLRPELCFAAGACLACSAMRDRSAWREAFALSAAGALSVLAFRWAMFRDVLPLSAYAKPAELGHGLRYLGAALGQADSWPALALCTLALRYGRREDRMHAAVMGAHVWGCVLAGGDWMPSFRLFAPLVPLGALTMAAGARTRRSWGTPTLGLAVALGVLGQVRELPAVRAAGRSREQGLPPLLASMAQQKSGAPDRPRLGPIMAVDIGALGYATGATMYDLGGLVAPEVAHAPGGHLAKRVDAAWVERSRPAWIVLHSALPPDVAEDRTLRRFAGYPVEQRVSRLPWVRANYRVRFVRRYAERYFYVVLGRLEPVGH